MAQPKRRLCGTMQVHQRLLEIHPPFRAKQGAIEQFTARRMAMRFAARRAGPVVIPVVVHVIYRTPDENITTAQIKSQIAVLNRDYGAKNPDRTKTPAVWAGLIGDAGVQFALATRGPNGKKTTGITRTKTTETSFADDDGVKSKAGGGTASWPSRKYLNLWVCTLGGGLLGYAQFPGGPAATDGVVILNSAFGTTGSVKKPFNLGRTATHEVGHWLNLHHVWGDRQDCSGTDYVADTPNAQLPNYHKPKFPHVSCHNGPNGDMFMNYMDYVDDDSMFMFTAGQVARMTAALDGPRKAIGKPKR